MKDIYTFKRDYDYQNIGLCGTVTNSIECGGWKDLADEFLEFLQGCGFVVDRERLAEHYTDYNTSEYD
jgi:hypothetical protein